MCHWNSHAMNQFYARLFIFCKTKVGEPLRIAKYPAAFNTGLLISGLVLLIIDNQTWFRLGILFVLLAFLGYAVIFAYCQVPPDGDLLGADYNRRQSMKPDAEANVDPETLAAERRAAAPMRLISVIANARMRLKRGSISAISLVSPREETSKKGKEDPGGPARLSSQSYPIFPVVEAEEDELETKPILDLGSDRNTALEKEADEVFVERLKMERMRKKRQSEPECVHRIGQDIPVKRGFFFGKGRNDRRKSEVEEI